MSPATGAPTVADRVNSSVSSSASTRRRLASGSTRWIFVSAPSTDADGVSRPSRRAASKPSTTTIASSSLSISGGNRNPGRTRYPPPTPRSPSTGMPSSWSVAT